MLGVNKVSFHFNLHYMYSLKYLDQHVHSALKE